MNSPDYICTPDLESYHGKLSYFWSSISSYLDPCNTGATCINSIKTTTALSSIAGNSVICEEGTAYQFNHVLGDAPVTWEVSPTNLFDTPTSGTGSNPTLYANNNSTNGLGQLNFFIGCDTVTKNVWVGVPDYQTDGFQIEGGGMGYESPLPCIYCLLHPILQMMKQPYQLNHCLKMQKWMNRLNGIWTFMTKRKD